MTFLDAQRRRFPRFQFEQSVTVALMRNSALTYAHASSTDLAEGGAGVMTNTPLSIGEVLELMIALPVGPLRVPACVRNRRGDNYGLEFLALGIPEREHIRDACKALPPLDTTFQC